MKKYDSPHCDAELVDFGDEAGGVYYAIHDHEKDGDVMSVAAYDAVERMIKRWLAKPGALNAKLNAGNSSLDIFLHEPDDDDAYMAFFKIDLADIFLAYAQNGVDWYGIPPSAVSAILRQLADDVDAIEGQ
jgi:hypothetical protein